MILWALLLLGSSGPASAPVEWGRPWVLVKGIVEVPYGVGGGVEVYAHRLFSVGVDVNASPAGTFTRASFHYWPEFHIGRRHNQFLFGAGGDVSVTFNEIAGGTAFVVVPASVDARYLLRIIPSVGFVLGIRAGVGFAVQARVVQNPNLFAASLVTYLGMSFGSR